MKLAFVLDDKGFISDYLVPAKDMMQSFQEAEFDDDVFYPDKVQGYKIAYVDGVPHAAFDEEQWQAYLDTQATESAKNEAQSTFNEVAKNYTLTYATDEDAYKMRYLYNDYEVGKDYKQGERFMHDGKFYKVLQDHTSQEDWTPSTAVSLYVEITDPSEAYPQWKQPTGAHDAYSIGDKVSHEGKKYISQIDANTTTPGADERWWKLEE